MIGLGAKYLTAAGFGRYRITAASLGNLDLLGTLIWLKPAAVQAILGAFGADGMAVINATNAYLKGIAVSDRDKATALAGFINEDPMMVCSLGLSGVPIRSLKGDGTAYINTLYIPNANTSIKAKAWSASGNSQVLSMRDSTSNGTSRAAIACFLSNTQAGVANPSSSGMVYNMVSCTTSDIIDYEVNVKDGYKRIYKNGTIALDMSFTPYFKETSYTIGMFSIDTAGNFAERGDMNIASAAIKEVGVAMRDYLPFRLGKAWSADKVSTGVAQAKDTLGMIDLVTGIFYPNAASSGAFTMEGEPTP